MVKFRGKTKDKLEKWIYGYYSHNSKRGIHMITEDNSGTWLVIPSTIAQFIGLKDKNDVEIYGSIEIDGVMSEGGDIIQECVVGQVIWDGDVIQKCPYGKVVIQPLHTNLFQIKKGVVKLKKGGTRELNITTYDGVYQWPNSIEIIGNQTDNRDLLE